MKRLYLPLILFLLLILEGVALEILPSGLFMSDLFIVSHWVLGFLMLMAVFYDKEYTYFSVLYALIFGLLIDIVYTGVLGVYMFSYALVIYIVHRLRKMLHSNIFVTLLLGAIGIALSDISVHTIFKVVGVTDVLWRDYFLYRLLPTVLANLLFLAALYPILMKSLLRWGQEQLSRSKSL
ncbi:rod shape-determining protein MreD [Virgibacillus sp. NKC19-3]|uniref:rod shape-determining protein MreD n=1 Tax=Virgibacillus saliphilus TaxID=2831674 RepID=UPI001C9BAFD2|nr:rod shape-determining protein MreD [Virgibacillus sp. NKC19-3]MBY7143255.1 rod shape-determining protein MreD [Virgibacillus sp. NKC19-3]